MVLKNRIKGKKNASLEPGNVSSDERKDRKETVKEGRISMKILFCYLQGPSTWVLNSGLELL